MPWPDRPVIDLLGPYEIVWLTDRHDTEGDIPGVAERKGEIMYPITGHHISALQEYRYGRTLDRSIPGVKASSVWRTMAAMASTARRSVAASTYSRRGVLVTKRGPRLVEHH